MGHKEEGFNPKYNKFSECFDNAPIFNEKRRQSAKGDIQKTMGMYREDIEEKMNQWVLSKMEKGKLIKYDKHLDDMERIRKAQYDRVSFL